MYVMKETKSQIAARKKLVRFARKLITDGHWVPTGGLYLDNDIYDRLEELPSAQVSKVFKEYTQCEHCFIGGMNQACVMMYNDIVGMEHSESSHRMIRFMRKHVPGITPAILRACEVIFEHESSGSSNLSNTHKLLDALEQDDHIKALDAVLEGFGRGCVGLFSSHDTYL